MATLILRRQDDRGLQTLAAGAAAAQAHVQDVSLLLQQLPHRGSYDVVVHGVLNERIGQVLVKAIELVGDVEEVVVAKVDLHVGTPELLVLLCDHFYGLLVPLSPARGPMRPRAVSKPHLLREPAAEVLAEGGHHLLVKALAQALGRDHGIEVHVEDAVALRPLPVHELPHALVHVGRVDPALLLGQVQHLPEVLLVPLKQRPSLLAGCRHRLLVSYGSQAAVHDEQDVLEGVGQLLGAFAAVSSRSPQEHFGMRTLLEQPEALGAEGEEQREEGRRPHAPGRGAEAPPG
mmetsp:Transcript_15132/g.43180  ORF Transcript_15132/g.43180 Transcript_15132/m.43180 type:complete len:290 (-) Transcript_15132:41-910(-)